MLLPILLAAMLAQAPRSVSSQAGLNITATKPAASVPVQISFREFFEPTERELKISTKLAGLNGKRVRIAGFMAHLETPLKGAFYLCPRPVFCDESGGGTADLPIEAVRVQVRSATNTPIVPTDLARSTPIEVTGVLELGNLADEDGRVSAIRLLLDQGGVPHVTNLTKKVRPHHSPLRKKRI